MSDRDHPLLKSARREAFVATSIWFVAMLYTLGICLTYGYGRDPKTLTFVLGFPDWVFYGIVAPWLTCAAVATLFAFCFMTDQPLEDDEPPAN